MKDLKSKFVAIEHDGEIGIHALPHGADGGYATLCGMDGDDPGCGQRPAELPMGAKIDCGQCKSIIRMARKYSEKDFYEPPR